jgi:ribose transport system ATP-binding protein
VAVLQAVSVELRPGEVHALVGENGAGKSTLCRIIAGLTTPSTGQMQLDARAHLPRSRRDAERAGVRMVMQELNLLATLSVAENIFLDSIPRRWLGIIDYRAMNAAAARALDAVGLHDIAPDRLVGSLGVGQSQLVEIAAALSGKCSLLILDEPTAALTAPEIALLFDRIRRLTESGVAVLYVSHRMEEIRAISDRITILRDGKYVGTQPTAALSDSEIVRLMVGRELPQHATRASARSTPRPMMRVRNLTREPFIHDVTFDLHAGEILGFAGLMGSGRTETMRAIFGADRIDAGEIHLRDSSTPARIRSPRDAVRSGIALLTEDRKSQGLLLPLSIAANTTLPRLSAAARLRCWIDPAREVNIAQCFIDRLSIRCQSPTQSVAHLSGGNQQKVVLAKWLLRDCDVVIFDEPTRGIDVGAKFEIYNLLSELARQGKGILVVSSDLLELLSICDRIAVMSAGWLQEIIPRAQCTQERIMSAALRGYSRTAQGTSA